MKSMELALTTLTAPGAAFRELRERPRYWLPLTLTLAGTVAVLFWYYSVVDIAWLADHLIDSNARLRQLPEAQREQAMASMTRTGLMVSAMVAAPLIIMVIRLIEAGYYSLAGKIANVQYSFRQWFALSWWTSLPHVLGIVTMAALLLLSDSNQLGSEELQVLSLNELFFHRAMGEPGAALLSSLTLLHPWAWALSVIGVRTWSGRSLAFCTVFALAPTVAIYGIWALFAFR
jgi:hypothetical protein